jgi:hypothetical protein
VELDEARLSFGIHQPVGVHAEALHHAIAARDGAIGHRPHQHVRDLGHQRGESPRRCRAPTAACGMAKCGSGLAAWHQVGKLHRVLDEEDRDVVADEIPVAFVGIELHREATDVPGGIG